MVVAGAGTGKTRVITERIRYLLDTQPELTGGEILGLTFTDKAAAEMKHRVVAAARDRGESDAERAEAVTLSTFHSFCNALLQEVDPDLKPIDNIDHWILLRRNLASCCNWSITGGSRSPANFWATLCNFSRAARTNWSRRTITNSYADQAGGEFQRVRGAMPDDERGIREEEIAKLQEIARAYRASDLLAARTQAAHVRLLRSWTPSCACERRMLCAKNLRARYRYILVDEFQDTNIAQLELLWLLGGERPNLVVVGDHRQAIYRFRGASFGSFTIFLERFAAGSTAAAAGIAAAAHAELPLCRTNPARGGTSDPPQRKTCQHSRIPAGRRARRRRKVRIVTHPTIGRGAVGGQ